jgi:hypothetical protein
VPPPGGVRQPGEGQEPCHQGHLEGQPRASQENACLETRVKELNDELIRMYRSRDFKINLLDDARTQLWHALDELTTAQSYVHHLETELHERDE